MHALWLVTKSPMQRCILWKKKNRGTKRKLRHERFELSRNIHCEAGTAKIKS